MAVAATQTAGAKHNIQAARRAYYDKAAKFHMAPLWEVLKNLVTPEPKTQCQPAVWNFGDVKKLMLEAGEVISAEEAERRVLVLENPGMAGQSRVTNSLFAGIQLILPGEIADVHQHVASAIRFVLDEGERARWHSAVLPKVARCEGAATVTEPVWTTLAESVSCILAETDAGGVEALVSFWGEPFMARSAGGDVPRYVFHVQRHSELIGRLRELERGYRRASA